MHKKLDINAARSSPCLHIAFSRRLPPSTHVPKLANSGCIQRYDVNPKASSAQSNGEPHVQSNWTVLEAASVEFKKVKPLMTRFLPMVFLFFLMAFANTILDSLKDALIITAHGGGAHLIPFLTVYAVFPSSLVFFFLYSFATQHYSRAQLFNSIIGMFMVFFAVFSFFLYPNQETLAPHEWADRVSHLLPSGLDGLVGMIRNWILTLFFCISELWGDVVLGLLFWGLANDTTSLSDAHLLYPLFGLGANLAQACAGVSLKMVRDQGSFSHSMQMLMLLVLVLAASSLIVHHWINKRAERSARMREEAAKVKKAEDIARFAGLDDNAEENRRRIQLIQEERTQVGNLNDDAPTSSSLAGDADPTTSSSEEANTKASLREALAILANSTPIRCLAVMSLAQGLCSSLMEFAWKVHISLLFPDPGNFTAFLGDVSTAQGIVTMILMLASPSLFKSIGWKGVAAATPQILLLTGLVFFVACLLYQFVAASSVLLSLVVFGGAFVFVFSRSAKFSLFKPAEEMVYISLDQDGRTKGKAAIDVVGAQLGKASGSFMQQALLLISGGAIAGSIAPMALVFILFNVAWLESVNRLSKFNPNYGSKASVHEDLMSLKSMDSDDESL